MSVLLIVIANVIGVVLCLMGGMFALVSMMPKFGGGGGSDWAVGIFGGVLIVAGFAILIGSGVML